MPICWPPINPEIRIWHLPSRRGRFHRTRLRTLTARTAIYSDAAVDHAMSKSSLHTAFGWTIHIGAESNPRSLRNFPMQANGAEMLRLACCLATERGVEVCAPVHDAVLICAPLDRLDADIAGMRAAMAEASRIVLKGFAARSAVAPSGPIPGIVI